ncbi:hypothetical protein N9E22_02940 [Burkholderiales bacterium]|nr:hypothetical protein [Burkholderiales bacterium]
MLRHLINPLRTLNLLFGIFKKKALERYRAFIDRRFQTSINRILAKINLPQKPRGIVAFFGCGFSRDDAVSALVMTRLADTHWLPISITSYMVMPQQASKSLNYLNGFLVRYSRINYRQRDDKLESNTLRFKWKIDMQGGRCVAAGIDFFPVVNSKLQRIHKAYLIDYSDPEITKMLSEIILSADAALGACFALKDYSDKTGIPLRFTGSEHVYVPTGVALLFCEHFAPIENVEFIDFGDAYAHYFTSGEYIDQHLFAIQNLTKSGNASRHVVSSKDFDAWVASISANVVKIEKEKAQQFLAKQSWTGGAEINAADQGVLDQIAECRQLDRPVVCIFGHVTFDAGTPNDLGFVHADMVDWLNDTLRYLSGKNVFVLVKPHPAEKRHKPSRKPNQNFEQLIHVCCGSNIHLLDALQFNTHQLIDMVDVGLFWRSSAALEFGLLGKPAIVCGSSATYANVINFFYPRTLAAYHEYLDNVAGLDSCISIPDRVALFWKFMREKQFISLPYVERSKSKRVDGFKYWSGHKHWSEGMVKRFYESGDENIDLIASILTR